MTKLEVVAKPKADSDLPRSNGEIQNWETLIVSDNGFLQLLTRGHVFFSLKLGITDALVDQLLYVLCEKGIVKGSRGEEIWELFSGNNTRIRLLSPSAF